MDSFPITLHFKQSLVGDCAVDKPDFLARGERSRLFPVLADTSKEGRTLSIFLACLENVDEFGRALLVSLGQRPGARTRIETFTEVILKNGAEKSHRPDGLILTKNGSRQWSSLVEAKVGNSNLTVEQIQSYIEIAKSNKIDTVVTISNQFAPLPTHHPLHAELGNQRKINILHWSWMFILTQATLLLKNDQIQDHDQRIILTELVRFLMHPSAGVKSFDQMPATWPEAVAKIQSGGQISTSSEEAREIMGAWHQELRDLAFALSRQINTDVAIQISRSHASDPNARLKHSVADFAKSNCLVGSLQIPAAASPVEVSADLAKRTVSATMRLKAPGDKKGTKARVTWLLRQLPKPLGPDIHLRLFWPGRTPFTQYPLSEIAEDPLLATKDRTEQVVLSFEILLVRDLAARFSQRRNFISDLEEAVPYFYDKIGQHLRSWRPQAPKLQDDALESDEQEIAAQLTEPTHSAAE